MSIILLNPIFDFFFFRSYRLNSVNSASAAVTVSAPVPVVVKGLARDQPGMTICARLSGVEKSGVTGKQTVRGQRDLTGIPEIIPEVVPPLRWKIHAAMLLHINETQHGLESFQSYTQICGDVRDKKRGVKLPPPP